MFLQILLQLLEFYMAAISILNIPGTTLLSGFTATFNEISLPYAQPSYQAA